MAQWGKACRVQFYSLRMVRYTTLFILSLMTVVAPFLFVLYGLVLYICFYDCVLLSLKSLVVPFLLNFSFPAVKIHRNQNRNVLLMHAWVYLKLLFIEHKIAKRGVFITFKVRLNLTWS